MNAEKWLLDYVPNTYSFEGHSVNCYCLVSKTDAITNKKDFYMKFVCLGSFVSCEISPICEIDASDEIPVEFREHLIGMTIVNDNLFVNIPFEKAYLFHRNINALMKDKV